jgi:hypothetical protein
MVHLYRSCYFELVHCMLGGGLLHENVYVQHTLDGRHLEHRMYLKINLPTHHAYF